MGCTLWRVHHVGEPAMTIRKPREEFTRNQRLAIIERAEWKCEECKRDLRSPAEKMIVDHILPLALGGESIISNGKLVCEWCDKPKTADDQRDISKADRIAEKHFLGRKPSKAWGNRR